VSKSSQLRQSDTEMVVLAALADRPMYGYLISKSIASRSGGELRLTPGVLYPLLARLERSGLIVSEWEEVKSDRSDEGSPGRKRKWYRLSPRGQKHLANHVASHRAYVSLMRSFMPEGAE